MASGPLKIIPIESAANLDALILQRRWRTDIRAEFRLADVPTGQAMRWETRTNQILQDCGCALAAMCTTWAMLILAGVAFIYAFRGKFHWPTFVLLAILTSIGAALAGKYAAHSMGRARLRAIAGELREFNKAISPMFGPSSVSDREKSS